MLFKRNKLFTKFSHIAKLIRQSFRGPAFIRSAHRTRTVKNVYGVLNTFFMLAIVTPLVIMSHLVIEGANLLSNTGKILGGFFNQYFGKASADGNNSRTSQPIVINSRRKVRFADEEGLPLSNVWAEPNMLNQYNIATATAITGAQLEAVSALCVEGAAASMAKENELNADGCEYYVFSWAPKTAELDALSNVVNRLSQRVGCIMIGRPTMARSSVFWHSHEFPICIGKQSTDFHVYNSADFSLGQMVVTDKFSKSYYSDTLSASQVKELLESEGMQVLEITKVGSYQPQIQDRPLVAGSSLTLRNDSV